MNQEFKKILLLFFGFSIVTFILIIFITLNSKEKPLTPQAKKIETSSNADKSAISLPTNENVCGNTPENLIYRGSFAGYKDYVYYSIPKNEEKLYRMRTNGTDKQKIGDIKTKFINIISDRILFVNSDDMDKIYVMDLEGKDSTIFLDESVLFLFIRGEWLYFIKETEPQSLYKMKVDKSFSTKILEDSKKTDKIFDPPQYNITSDYIYYVDSSNALCKVNFDGSDKTVIAQDNTGPFIVIKNWIYYINHSDSNKIYKVKTDGSRRAKFVDENVISMNASDGYIYFSLESKGTYKMKYDGTGVKRLTDITGCDIHTYDKWIYFWDHSSGCGIAYQAKNDGKVISTINQK